MLRKAHVYINEGRERKQDGEGGERRGGDSTSTFCAHLTIVEMQLIEREKLETER